MDSEVEQLHLRADSLVLKFVQDGEVENIEEAIALDRQALDLSPPGHLDRSTSLNNLAAHLSIRYHKLGGISDLNEAIDFDQEALDLRQQEHPDRSMSLNNLAAHLSTRYNCKGDVADLDKAIGLNREALDLCPRGHPDRSIYMNNLAIHLSTRSRKRGTTTDLEEAIELSREALDLRPEGHPNRSKALYNLAVDLSVLYSHRGELEYIEEAIDFSRKSLELCPRGHYNRSRALNNLAGPLATRYRHSKELRDLEEALILGREALYLRPQGHPDRSVSLSNLAGFLSARYNHLGTMEDLDQAIDFDREALDLRPQEHPDHMMSLNTLADLLSARYTKLKTTADIDEAIFLSREAFNLCPRGHLAWSTCLNNLARRLRTRFMQSSEAEDKEELFKIYTQLEHAPQTVSLNDLFAAKAWVDAAEELQHHTKLDAYKSSHQLLIQHLAPLESFSSCPTSLKKLTSSLTVDALSAYLRTTNHAATDAIELFEFGREAFWNQLTRLRSPLEDLAVFPLPGKRLSEEFRRLSKLIHDALSSPDPAQHRQVLDLAKELQEVTNDIQQLPGLSRFLLRPLFSHLRLAANGGPVVIVNAGTYSCDALIIRPEEDPAHIPLQITKERGRELASKFHALTLHERGVDVTEDITVILRELWDLVVSPIVNFLQPVYQPQHQSRIWWCPTAEFFLLPLHAAGPYREGQYNLDDLYISSYTRTLTALIYARRRYPTSSAMERKHVVAIGHTHPRGENEHASVGTELSHIAQHLENLTTFTRLEGPECYISRVSEEIGKNEWIHLACHDLPNSKQPIESAFALHDGDLTIRQIAQCGLQNPEFAYLSARHMSVGDEEVLDEVDEMIHPAFVVQSAGFRSVIGTMWAVDNDCAVNIASKFYAYMLDGGHLDYARVAFALHKTMKSLEDIPLDQRIRYIHVGA